MYMRITQILYARISGFPDVSLDSICMNESIMKWVKSLLLSLSCVSLNSHYLNVGKVLRIVFPSKSLGCQVMLYDALKLLWMLISLNANEWITCDEFYKAISFRYKISCNNWKAIYLRNEYACLDTFSRCGVAIFREKISLYIFQLFRKLCGRGRIFKQKILF